MSDELETFIDGVKLVISKEFPDINKPYRYPAKAKVIKVYSDLSVDLQLLDKYGSPDTSSPPFPRVPLPKGVTQIISDSEVRVGFYYNDPTQVFIEAIL